MTLPNKNNIFINMKYYCDNGRHLICIPYSIENLHSMAKDLNIKRCWFHNHKKYPHYDIPKRRIEEIKSQCEVISTKEIILLILKWHK